MVVQHNMQSMNASRMLNITAQQQAKSTEKLSSGYRINRAADDAAGLSISEKMRKQIRGLSRAAINAEDGVSAVQTAEGALTEVHDMLQRMNELAIQAANGTNAKSDREAIQNEIDQLVTEIDRVAETTKFNETYLLKGDPSGATKMMYLTPKDAGLNGKIGEICTVDHKFSITMPGFTVGDKVTIGGIEYDIIAGDTGSEDFVNEPDKITRRTAIQYIFEEIWKANDIGAVDKNGGLLPGAITANEGKYTDYPDMLVATIEASRIEVTQPLTFNLHVGADSAMSNKINVNIDKMDAASLGIKGLDVVGVNDEKITKALQQFDAGDPSVRIEKKLGKEYSRSASGTAATYAIDAIASAIQKVSDQRSALGAVQNRLEHSIANLDNVVENTTAAESRIRDTDMADEMVRYSMNNILAQAGQSMLAQANQSTQGVLSILG